MEKQQEQTQTQNKFQKCQSQIPAQLRQLWLQQQTKIKKHIVQVDHLHVDTLNLVAGVDLSASKINPDYACAALIVYDIKLAKEIYSDCRLIQINQPYCPGFLAFREVPPLYHMFKQLKEKHPEIYPEIILVDGNGILHSNQCGLASHLGVLTQTPTIGVGKTLFYIDGLGKDRVKEQCQVEIKKAGDYSLLKGDSGRVWGAGVRNTQAAINPIFVSIGTMISLETAIKVVLKLSLYRVVEPIRLADKISRQIIQKVDIQKLQKGKGEKVERFQMVFIDDLGLINKELEKPLIV